MTNYSVPHFGARYAPLPRANTDDHPAPRLTVPTKRSMKSLLSFAAFSRPEFGSMEERNQDFARVATAAEFRSRRDPDTSWPSLRPLGTSTQCAAPRASRLAAFRT